MTVIEKSPVWQDTVSISADYLFEIESTALLPLSYLTCVCFDYLVYYLPTIYCLDCENAVYCSAIVLFRGVGRIWRHLSFRVYPNNKLGLVNLLVPSRNSATAAPNLKRFQPHWPFQFYWQTWPTLQHSSRATNFNNWPIIGVWTCPKRCEFLFPSRKLRNSWRLPNDSAGFLTSELESACGLTIACFIAAVLSVAMKNSSQSPANRQPIASQSMQGNKSLKVSNASKNRWYFQELLHQLKKNQRWYI